MSNKKELQQWASEELKKEEDQKMSTGIYNQILSKGYEVISSEIEAKIRDINGNWMILKEMNMKDRHPTTGESFDLIN